MNRIVNHLVNEIVVKALARNKGFQSIVVRAVDSIRSVSDRFTGAAKSGDAGAGASASAQRAHRPKIKPEIPENAAEEVPKVTAKKAAADPRDKGFFGHLTDVVKNDVSDMFGRR